MNKSEIEKTSFRYPMSYPLNNDNVNKFIEATADDAKDVVRKFINATTHISFEKFLSYINSNLADVINKTNTPMGRRYLK